MASRSDSKRWLREFAAMLEQRRERPKRLDDDEPLGEPRFDTVRSWEQMEELDDLPF